MIMIKNISKKKVVSQKFVYLKGFIEISKGFIGKSNLEAVIFTTRFGIHTFGLRFPIDVIILDDQKKVVSLKENLKPYRIFIWNPKYKLVVEINKELIKNSNTKIGDLLQIDL